MKNKKIKIFGIGATILLVFIALTPLITGAYHCPCTTPDNLPETCPPPDTPGDNYLGTYHEDGLFGAFWNYWVYQEYNWVVHYPTFSKDCCEDDDSTVSISITRQSSVEITEELEAQFSFLEFMFGGSIGTTMGFSSSTTVTSTDIFHGMWCKYDKAVYYLKETRLRVVCIWFNGWQGGEWTAYSSWYGPLEIQFRECHFNCKKIITPAEGENTDCGCSQDAGEPVPL